MTYDELMQIVNAGNTYTANSYSTPWGEQRGGDTYYLADPNNPLGTSVQRGEDGSLWGWTPRDAQTGAGGGDFWAYGADGALINSGFRENTKDWKDSLIGAAGVLGGSALAANFVGPMLEAWAAGSGLSPAASSSFSFSSPAQGQAAATWGAGGAAEVAGGAGASALSGGAPAASGGLTMEGILGSNFAAPTLGTEIGAGAMYGAPTSLPGAMSAMTTGAATGSLLEQGLSNSFGAPNTAGAPGVAGVPGVGGRPTGQGGSQNPNQSVLEQLMGGNLNMDGLMRLLSGAIGASQQNRFADQLLQRANDATPNRGFYEGQLRQTYENPGAFLQSPEYQAVQDITHNKLQRSDAAGGRLANDYGRQIGLQNNAMSQLDQHRRTLSGITGQNQQTYSGQNSMFMQGAQADNSWMNGILSSLMSRPQGNTGAPNTGGFNFGQIPNLFQGSGTTPQINLDAIA